MKAIFLSWSSSFSSLFNKTAKILIFFFFFLSAHSSRLCSGNARSRSAGTEPAAWVPSREGMPAVNGAGMAMGEQGPLLDGDHGHGHWLCGER